MSSTRPPISICASARCRASHQQRGQRAGAPGEGDAIMFGAGMSSIGLPIGPCTRSSHIRGRQGELRPPRTGAPFLMCRRHRRRDWAPARAGSSRRRADEVTSSSWRSRNGCRTCRRTRCRNESPFRPCSEGILTVSIFAALAFGDFGGDAVVVHFAGREGLCAQAGPRRGRRRLRRRQCARFREPFRPPDVKWGSCRGTAGRYAFLDFGSALGGLPMETFSRTWSTTMVPTFSMVTSRTRRCSDPEPLGGAHREGLAARDAFLDPRLMYTLPSCETG